MRSLPNNGRYVLDDQGNPVPEPDLWKWAEWMEGSNKRMVQQTRILPGKYLKHHYGQVAPSKRSEIRISTVFLALDYSFSDEDIPPVLWESMIFMPDEKHELHLHMNRYTSKDAALAGHAAMVKRILDLYPDTPCPQS